MNNLNEYRKRFRTLMESTIGNVKPLINEYDENKKVSNFLSSVDADGDGVYDDYDGTNEELMYKTIISISSSSEYFRIDGEVKKKTGKPISFWIKNELQKAMDILAVGNCDESSDYYKQVKMFCHMNDIGVSKQSEWTKDDCKKFFKNCDGDSDLNGIDSNSSIWPTSM